MTILSESTLFCGARGIEIEEGVIKCALLGGVSIGFEKIFLVVEFLSCD